VILIVSVMPLGWVREPSIEPEEKTDPGNLLRESARVWRENAGFRRFLYGQIALVAASLASPFFILAAISRGHATPAAVAGYTAALGFAGAFGGLLWGAWADRSGNKIVLIASSALAILAPAGAILAAHAGIFYAVFASATGGYRAGFILSAALTAVGLLLTLRVKEPRRARTEAV
jgi:MFS family permease